MAKLTPPVGRTVATAPLIPAAAPASAAPANQTPTPFAVVAPTKSRDLKAPNKASAKTKSTRLDGATWFAQNIPVGDVTAVIQIQRFSSRSQGFKCPHCGITGTNGIVVRALPGKGNPILIQWPDPTTREMVPAKADPAQGIDANGMVMGFHFGGTCLRKYGKIDITKLNEKPEPPTQVLTPEVTTPAVSVTEPVV